MYRRADAHTGWHMAYCIAYPPSAPDQVGGVLGAVR